MSKIILESPIEWEHLTIEKQWDNQYNISHEDSTTLCDFGIYKDNIIYSFHSVKKVYKDYILLVSEKIAKWILIIQ